MPYELSRHVKDRNVCWRVTNTETKEVKAYCTTYAKAVRQKRLLESIDKSSRSSP